MLSHNELQKIYGTIFGKGIKGGISDFFAQDMDNEECEHRTEILWKTDALIGGIGGYCMPANPVKNPFPSGVKRELYRPLQYARSSIDMCDVRIFARTADLRTTVSLMK